MKRAVTTALRLVVGVVAIAFLLSKIDMDQAAETLRSASPAWLLVAFGAQLVSKTWWTLRWRTLLASLGHGVGGLTLFRLILVGLFFNYFLPSSVGGDVVRGLTLGAHGISRADAAASVIGDRVVGLLALGTMAVLGGALGAWFWPGDGPWLASGAFALGVIALILVFTRPQMMERVTAFPMPEGLRTKIRRLVTSASVVARRPGAVRRALVFSILLSTTSSVFHWAIGRSIGIQVPLPAYFVIVPAVMLVAALPITLNGLGLRELGFVGFLGAQGVPQATAAVFALLVFLGTIGWGVAGGVLFLAGDRAPTQREGRA
jgi:hypothetical protein